MRNFNSIDLHNTDTIDGCSEVAFAYLTLEASGVCNISIRVVPTYMHMAFACSLDKLNVGQAKRTSPMSKTAERSYIFAVF